MKLARGMSLADGMTQRVVAVCETLDPKPESSPQRRMKQRPGTRDRCQQVNSSYSRTTSPAMTAGSARSS